MARRVPPAEDEVHLWSASLDVDGASLEELGRTLSADERDRALRMRLERDRTRFIAARGWLRRLLGGYVDTDATELVFAVSTDGKPDLVTPAVHWIRFNVSHSDDLAVYAVANGRDVGVDVERVRDDIPMDDVARRFFSVSERATIDGLPEPRRRRAAYACWTRKEAYLKAVGVGLAPALDTVEFDVVDGDRDELWTRSTDRREWAVHGFTAGPLHAAAVAVAGRRVRVPSAATSLRLAADSAPQRHE
jgi:4'-phosphopantetheinyl transferase